MHRLRAAGLGHSKVGTSYYYTFFLSLISSILKIIMTVPHNGEFFKEQVELLGMCSLTPPTDFFHGAKE